MIADKNKTDVYMAAPWVLCCLVARCGCALYAHASEEDDEHS